MDSIEMQVGKLCGCIRNGLTKKKKKVPIRFAPEMFEKPCIFDFD